MNFRLFCIPLLLLGIACSESKSGKNDSEKGDSPKDKEIPTYTIEQFLTSTRYSGGAFSPDESKLLISSDRDSTFDAFELSFEGKLNKLTKLKSHNIFAQSYFPNDERMILTRDDNGNEIFHVYLREENGEMRDLTPDEGARASFMGWARDEQSFFISSNKRDPKYMDIYELDIETFEPTMIFKNEEGYSFAGMTSDKRYMAFVKTITNDNNNMYLYDRESGEMKLLSEHEGNITYRPVDFTVDNKNLMYLTDENSEFTYLKNYNIETGEKTQVQKENWDINYAYFSYNEKYRVVGINQDAQTVIKIYDVATGDEVKFPEFPGKNISSVRISKSENKMMFRVGSSKSPSDMYLYDFSTGKHQRLTRSLTEEIDENFLVDGEVIRYPSFDNLDIPAILYKPHQANANAKVPALVWVHGGPGGQSRMQYFELVQYLVNHGYAILAVNNRGSSGYGKTFFGLDDRRHGEDDLQDCIYGKKYLQGLDYIDPDKIGIIGGSYGGYMTLAALAFQPQEFEVGVDIFGVSNWLRTLESIPPWWESFRKALYNEMGDPATDSERLHKISPLFHADRIEKPLMVLQGATDPRVLKVESDEIVEAVKANNVPVEYVVFEDEGHGFLKKANRIKGYQSVLKFLDEHLKGSS